MANPEQKNRPYSLRDRAVKGELRITPDKYTTEHLQSVVAAQMLTGGREIIIPSNKKDAALIIPEKTLVGLLKSPPDVLKSFLGSVLKAMLASEEVIIREVPTFSSN